MGNIGVSVCASRQMDKSSRSARAWMVVWCVLPPEGILHSGDRDSSRSARLATNACSRRNHRACTKVHAHTDPLQALVTQVGQSALGKWRRGTNSGHEHRPAGGTRTATLSTMSILTPSPRGHLTQTRLWVRCYASMLV